METKIDLELISTDDLIHELADRHSELIIIREHKKGVDEDKVFVKTPFGELSKEDKGFDLVIATDMIHAAQRQLVIDFLEPIENNAG